MVSIPSLQIHQQYARLGIDADIGQQDIRQPRASINLQTVRPQLKIHSTQGDLQIDQSEAWSALGVGGHLAMMNHIYSEAHNVAMQGIARIVDNGNRLAAIHKGFTAIPDIARQQALEFFEFNYLTPASYDNVDVFYTARPPEIVVEMGRVDLDARVNPPQIEYIRGKLDIYMQQYAKVDIIPPQIDLQV